MGLNHHSLNKISNTYCGGVRAELIATGPAPANLELELTETVLDAESAVVILLALKDMGVRLTIDDFGTGLFQPCFCGAFRLDTIKLDQSFVQTSPSTLKTLPLSAP